MTPPLDGTLGSAGDPAGRVNAVGGAMAEGQRIFETLRYGWDDTAVYLAFEYVKKPVPMDVLMETLKRAHRRFKSIKHAVDTALMASAFAQAGEVELAREIMQEETPRDQDDDQDG